MNPKYTYRRSTGIYYFRLVKYCPEQSRNIDIRFALKTRIPFEAKSRAMSAWLHAQNLIMSGNFNPADITAKVKAAVFTNDCLTTHQVAQFKGAIPSVVQSNEIDDYGNGGIQSAMVEDEFTAYAKRKLEDGQWTGKTGLENKSIFDTFIEVVGNKPVTSITKADIEQYATVVNHLPPNRKKNAEYRSLSSSEPGPVQRRKGQQ